MKKSPKIIFIFLDGVGIGKKDKKTNPFFAHHYPAFFSLFGNSVPHIRSARKDGRRLSVVPVNATLGVPGLPQSGTGQAALLTGVNAPRIVGRHFGPYLHSSLKPVVKDQNIFRQIGLLKKMPYYANAFPRQFLEHVRKGGRMSAISYAWLSAGYRLNGGNAIAARRALSADLTNARWHSFGYKNLPVITGKEAGRRLVSLTVRYDFVLFEYFFTDYAGHSQSMEESVRVLHTLDGFIDGILNSIDPDRILLLLTSDHGNLEDLRAKTHTRNPVPLLAYGKGHSDFASRIRKLTDVVPAVLDLMK